jgi:hypothetical protein
MSNENLPHIHIDIDIRASQPLGGVVFSVLNAFERISSLETMEGLALKLSVGPQLGLTRGNCSGFPSSIIEVVFILRGNGDKETVDNK